MRASHEHVGGLIETETLAHAAQEPDICVSPEEIDLIKTSIVVAVIADFGRYSPKAGAARKDQQRPKAREHVVLCNPNATELDQAPGLCF